MDTELLKTFLEVNRTRHFGKAAENLYVTPAAVSFRIRQLESQLGVPLFNRHRNNIQLTSAGEKLVGHAKTVLMTWQRAKQEVALDDRRAVQLAVAAPANIWDALMTTKLSQIGFAMPDIALKAEIATPPLSTRMLLERTTDLLVVFEPPQVDGVHIELMGQLELVLVSVNPGVDAGTALRENYIQVDWGTACNIQLAKLFPNTSPATLHTAAARIAMEYLATNGGAAFLPRGMVEPMLAQGSLHLVIGTPVITRNVYACYLADCEKLDLVEQAMVMFKTDDSLSA